MSQMRGGVLICEAAAEASPLSPATGRTSRSDLLRSDLTNGQACVRSGILVAPRTLAVLEPSLSPILRSAAAAVLVLLTANCSRSNAPPGAKYKFTSDGTGPEGTNLSPLRVGQAGGAGDTSIVDGMIAQGASQATRVHDFHLEGYESFVDFPIGQFSTATSVFGVLESPKLVVPAKVRVGMAWTTSGEGGSTSTFTVLARTENAPTFFGPATLWTIEQVRSDGVKTARQYAEGFGELTRSPQIWPIESQTVTPPPPLPVTLTELVLPATLAFTQNSLDWVDALSMVRPDEGAAMLIVAGSYSSNANVAANAPTACVVVDSRGLTPLALSHGTPFRRTRGLTCPSATYEVNNPVAGAEGFLSREMALHANGVAISDDGLVTWIPRKWTGEMVWSSTLTTNPDSDVFGDDVTSRTGGGERPILAFPGRDGGADALTMALDLDTGRVGLPEYFHEPASSNPLDYRKLEHSFPVDRRLRHLLYKEVTEFGVDAQGRHMLLLRDRENMVFWSRLEGERFTHPRAGGRISGRLSVQARRGRTEVLRVTADGSVDRLVLVNDELQLEHLADAQLPKGQFGIGAFVDGDHLLIGTLAVGTPGTVSLHLLRSSPLSASKTVPIPQALTLYQRAIDGSVGQANAVCWRQTGQPVDLSTWKLDGLDPDLREEVRPADQCVVVGSDSRHDTKLREQISGVVPGVGKVFVRAPPGNASVNADLSTALNPDQPIAVLDDGSLVTTRRRFSWGGYDLGLPDELGPEPSKLGWAGVADLGGAGLWTYYDRLDGSAPSFVLKAAVTHHFPGVDTPTFALWPTGVATQSRRFEFADGGWVPTRTDINSVACTRTANGSECGIQTTPGVNATTLYCDAPDGSTRTVPNPERTADCANWLPRGDGTYVLPQVGKLVAFDPASMTLTVENPSVQLMGAGFDHKGRGLFVTLNSDGTHTIHLATRGFPEAISVPESVWTMRGSISTIGFISTPEVTYLVLTFAVNNGPQGKSPPVVIRLPPVP
jgi:hypothetical protein